MNLYGFLGIIWELFEFLWLFPDQFPLWDGQKWVSKTYPEISHFCRTGAYWALIYDY